MSTISVKIKKVQVHNQCNCGCNVVYEDYFFIRWKEFKAAQIKRRTDKKTGKPFLFMKINTISCDNCDNEI